MVRPCRRSDAPRPSVKRSSVGRSRSTTPAIIDPDAIVRFLRDHGSSDRRGIARGLGDDHDGDAHHDQPSGFKVLLTCRPLLIFAGATVLFHFSNAAMLPLVGQKLALVDDEERRRQQHQGQQRAGDDQSDAVHGVLTL